ncbi:hypothetical protein K470DRAFT_12775 [Piedraia hortae CBS 480.64]|uniref:Uncharacterized protein n=1 Tax=Piedraia hortae CBS 480.64 TaxID=1314780 RepID=A0A6A7BP46_9PEZI|nr:hypothetical protein K470DRAFT_12775 [Piedraia hortae CBS 480.64]
MMMRLLEEAHAILMTKLRHMDIHRFWLRQEVQQHAVEVDWISPPTTWLSMGSQKLSLVCPIHPSAHLVDVQPSLPILYS